MNSGNMEFFVHFEGVDRRLDQWLDVDKIDISGDHGMNEEGTGTPNNDDDKSIGSHSITTNKSLDKIKKSESKESTHIISDIDSEKSFRSRLSKNSEKSKSVLDPSTNKRQKNNSSNQSENQRITRKMKRIHNDVNHIGMSMEEMDPLTRSMEKEHNNITKVKYIDKLFYFTMTNTWEIKTWYF